MKISNIWSVYRIDRILVYVTGYLLLISSVLAIQNCNDIPRYWIFVFGFIGYCLYYNISTIDYIIQRGSTRSFLISSLFVIILLRLIWIIEIPTIPYSDFAVYNNFAISIAKQFPAHILSINCGERGFGYCFALGIIYKIFGINLFIAKLLNVLFSALTGILLYMITRHLFDERVSRITTVLFSIWPAQIMYNSVLASEHMFILVIFLGIAMISGVTKVKLDNKYVNVFLAGIIFGLAYTIRFLSLVIVATGLMALLFVREEAFKRRIRLAFCLISGFAIVWTFMTIISAIVNIPCDPSTGVQHSLLVGTNYEYKGMWNPVDSQIWNDYSPNDAKKIAFKTGLSRITENPKGFIKLLFEKFDVMWGDESFGAYWSTFAMDSTRSPSLTMQDQLLLFAVSQFYYFGVLFFSLLGCHKLRNTELNLGIRFLLMIFLTVVLLHSFLEVQPRYHYPWEVIFLILGGYGIVGKPVALFDRHSSDIS